MINYVFSFTYTVFSSIPPNIAKISMSTFLIYVITSEKKKEKKIATLNSNVSKNKYAALTSEQYDLVSP